MEIDCYPADVRKFLNELIKRNAISIDTLKDKTFVNYLYTQRFDMDYIDCMSHDRRAE